MATSTKAYIFKGTDYIRYDVQTKKVDAGYPQNIKNVWKLPFDSVDASVMWTNGKVYFFKGSQYAQYDFLGDIADTGYPQPISDWEGMPFTSIDAVVLWTSGKAFFFQGNQYAKFDIASKTFDEGYPKSIKENWTDLSFESLDSAVSWNNGKAYFFKNNQYVSYDLATDKADEGYPQLISKDWGVLPFSIFDNALVWAEPVIPEPLTPIDEPVDSPNANILSDRRKKVIETLLPQVIVAKYKGGTKEEKAKFTRLLPGVNIEEMRKNTPTYTTCGALPQFVLANLGFNEPFGITGGGLAGVRDGIEVNSAANKNKKVKEYKYGAIKLQAWIPNDGIKRPKQGDVYLLGDKNEKDPIDPFKIPGVVPKHIGVIVSVTNNIDGTETWRTADAGQGSGVNQEATYQNRTYLPNEKTLSGIADKGKVLGWVDIDLLP